MQKFQKWEFKKKFRPKPLHKHIAFGTSLGLVKHNQWTAKKATIDIHDHNCDRRENWSAYVQKMLTNCAIFI